MTPLLVLTALLGASPDGQLLAHRVVPLGASQPKLILAPRDVGQAAMHVRFDAGAFYDGGLPGLTRLTQFGLLYANRVMSAAKLTELLYRADAKLEVHTGQLVCSFELSAPAERFESVAAPLLEALLAPRLDEGELASARHRMFHQPLDLSNVEASAILSRAVIPERGYEKDTRGDRGLVRGIGFGTVQKHQRTYFRPARATIAITGRFDAARFEKLVARFKGGTPREPYPLESDLAGLHATRWPWQLHLLALPFPLGTAEQAAAAHLGRSILAERVYRHFRSHGLAYTVGSAGLRAPWLDFILISVSVVELDQGLVQKQLTELINGVAKTESLDAADFERYRTALLRELEAVDATPAALAEQLVMGGLREPWMSPEVVAAVRQMPHERFQSLVRTWLRSEALVHLLMTPNPPKRVLR